MSSNLFKISDVSEYVRLGIASMIDSTLFMVGKYYTDKKYIEKSNSCMMCKRLIINAGIKYVIIRDNKNEYREIEVNEWIENDDSLSLKSGY